LAKLCAYFQFYNCSFHCFNHSRISDVRTSSADFVIYAKRLGRILVEDALTEIPTEEICIETPCGKYDGVITPYIENNNICAVSILRAGNCLLESVLECLPGIQVGYLLIQRNEDSLDKKAGHFYTKLPKDIHNNKCVLLCDPMVCIYQFFRFVYVFLHLRILILVDLHFFFQFSFSLQQVGRQ